MTKSEAIKLFSSVAEIASSLGISRQAVYKWPEQLPQEQADRLVGAAIRTGRLRRPLEPNTSPQAGMPEAETAQATGRLPGQQPLPDIEAAGQEAA